MPISSCRPGVPATITRSSVAQRHRIPETTHDPACNPMDVDVALITQVDSFAVVDSVISPVDDLPTQVHLPPESAKPTPPGITYVSDDDEGMLYKPPTKLHLLIPSMSL